MANSERVFEPVPGTVACEHVARWEWTRRGGLYVVRPNGTRKKSIHTLRSLLACERTIERTAPKRED
jgi:hypothetical protein